MSIFFKPYEGTRPFFFVSYAHKQSAAVVDTIRVLHERGFRLWYDEGIPAGSDWPANIAHHMQTCERVLFFQSARAMESPNCYSEICTAVRLGKPILVIHLEKSDRDDRWRELLGNSKEIFLLNTPAERAEAILASGFLTRRFRHSLVEKIPWQALGLAVSFCFFLAAAGTLFALASGIWVPYEQPEVIAPTPTPTPTPTAEPTPIPVVELGEAERFFAVTFSDSLTEKAVRKALNIPEGEIYRWQVAEIKELYFCGNMVLGDLSAVTFESDGTCRVNGAPVITGQVSDLTLLESAVRLEKLALVCQPLEDISGLSDHLLLNELSLAGSSVGALDALTNLPSLETLHLEHTDVRDLAPISSFSNLKTVTVSRSMLPLTWEDDAAFRVVLIRESSGRDEK